MPLPRLDFVAHDRPGQIVFTLELDPTRVRGGRSKWRVPLMLGGAIAWIGEIEA